MEIHSSVTIYQGIQQTDSQNKLQTSQQPTIYLQNNRKCTLNQLPKHCDMYSFLPEYQSTYRKFYICETSLLKLVNVTLWAMEKQQITVALIMDLSAGFNAVDHDLLLNVLQGKVGITNTALRWYNFLKSKKKKKIQSVHQWLILIRMNHRLWPTPRIQSRCIPIQLLCLNTH